MAGQYGEFVINLRRNNLNTAWGFRLQGGKEFNTYLSIQRVFNGSPSDGHLQRGDVIVAVDNEDVSHWHQKQAYDLIQTIGLTLAIVVRRGGSDTDARPAPPSQAQPVESFVRKPFGQQQPQPQPQQQAQSHHPQYAQQQQQHQQQHHQLSPQMTSKATLNFQSAPPSQPYAPPPSSHLSTDRENIGPSSSSSSGVAPWTQQHSPTPNQNSFSTPFQVRSVQPPPQKAYSSYSPQQSDSYAPGNAQSYAGSQGASQAPYQQDQSGGRAPFGRDSYQRDAAQTSQQPSYNEESNHVTYDRNQSAGAGSAQESRNEPAYNEGRKEEGGEEEDYQALSVRDIKQMFNKPDQKGAGPVSRIKRSPVAWTRPVDTASSAYGGVAPGPRPGQHSSLSPIRPGSIQRCPAVSDDFRKSYSPPAQPNYGQPRFASPPGVGKPTATVNVNKQGGAYAGIIQPSLPPKTTPAAAKPGQKGPQKKKDFDPNQSAVYKILLEEEERAKNQPHQQEEEEEEAPRRQAQGQKQGQRGKAQPQQGQRQPQKQQQGSRLDELLERDMAQLAPYKQEQSQHQEQRAPYQEQRSPYQEPRAPHQEQRSAYQEPRAPYQEQRSAYEEPKAPYQEQRSAYEEPKAPYQEQRSPYQEPRAPYQEQRSPYQEPRAPTYQEPGYSQPHRNEVHQPRSPARGGASGGWQPPSGPYGSQDYGSASFPQTQLVDGIPTSDF